MQGLRLLVVQELGHRANDLGLRHLGNSLCRLRRPVVLIRPTLRTDRLFLAEVVELRATLEASFDISPSKRLLDKQSADSTEKLLLQMADRSLVETVVIRAPQIGVGLNKSRKTICISTQVGCAYGCKFCASGLSGWKRDLSAGEIVSQLIQVCYQEDTSTPRADESIASFDNIVVMGMGEPLANYENLLESLRILNAPWGLNFGARRITVSTSGIVPKILELAKEPEQFRLAISLHGETNDVRDA